MAGYYGYSMSNNAKDAYACGEMPISKWTKKAIIESIEEGVEGEEINLQCSLEKLKKLPLAILKSYYLIYSSWHHTSKFYNETDFYSLDISYIEGLTDEDLERLAFYHKEELRKLREKKTPEEKEAEKIRKAAAKAAREAEKAIKEEKMVLFKHQKNCKTLAGFMRSQKVDFEKLREVRKKRIAEKREELRRVWEQQGFQYGLEHLDDDRFVDGYIKQLS
ncbi:MAG: hypothetical protein NC307_15705 [Roseburia sp.]|nr:hypothetical protein [Roseburia sp.]